MKILCKYIKRYNINEAFARECLDWAGRLWGSKTYNATNNHRWLYYVDCNADLVLAASLFLQEYLTSHGWYFACVYFIEYT